MILLLHALRGKPQPAQPLQPCGVRTVYPDGWHLMTEQQRFKVTASAIEKHYVTLPMLDRMEVMAKNYLSWIKKSA